MNTHGDLAGTLRDLNFNLAASAVDRGRYDEAVICLQSIVDNRSNSRAARAHAVQARSHIERHMRPEIEAHVRALQVCPAALGGPWLAMMPEWHAIREARI